MRLSPILYKQIVIGKRTELRFPASKRCPVQQGHHYGMQRSAKDDLGHRFEVVAVAQRGRQWVCLVRLAQDVPQFMAKQDGQVPGPQYVFGAQGAIDDAETIPDLDQRRMSKVAEEKDKIAHREKAANLLGACEEVRSAVANLDPALKKSISRDLWTLKGRLDTLERKLRRQAA